MEKSTFRRGIATSEFWRNAAILVIAVLSILAALGIIHVPVTDSLTGQITTAAVAIGAVLGAAHSNVGYAASRARVKETQAFQEAHAKR